MCILLSPFDNFGGFFSFWDLILHIFRGLLLCVCISLLRFLVISRWLTLEFFLWTFDRIVYHAETLLLLLIKTHKSSFFDTQSSLGVNSSLSCTLASYMFSEPLRPFILVPEDNTGEWNYNFLTSYLICEIPLQTLSVLCKTCIKMWLWCQLFAQVYKDL